MSLVCRYPGKALLGVAAANGDASLLATVQRDGIICHSIEAQDQVHSYPLGSSRRNFALPAVACGQTVYAVTCESTGQSQALVSWELNQKDFKSISDLTTSVPLPGGATATAIHVLASASQSAGSSSQPVLVLSDCRVGLVSKDGIRIAEQGQLQPPGSAPTPRATAAAGNILAVASQASAGAQCTVQLYRLAGGAVLPHRTLTAKAPSAGATLQTLSLSPREYVLLLWSSGAVSVLSGLQAGQLQRQADFGGGARPAAGAAAAAAAATPASSRKRKGGPAESEQSGATVLAAAVDDTQFVYMTLAPAASGGSSAEVRYSLVDRQFGCSVTTATASLDVPVPAPAGGKDGAHCALYTSPQSPNLLLLQVDGAVFSIRLETSPANLLSLVGKLALGASQPAGVQSALPQPALPATVLQQPQPLPVAQLLPPPPAASAPATSAGPAATALATATEEDALVLRALPTDASTSSSTAAAAASGADLTQRLAGLATASGAGSGEAAAQAARALTQALGHRLALPPVHLVGLLVVRLLEAERWQELQELLPLLPDYSLPGSTCGQLLPAAAQAGQYLLLADACRKVDEPDASCVVGAVLHLLTPTTAANQAARQQYYRHVRQAAETVVQHAEAVAGAAEAAHALPAARRAAAIVDGFSRAQLLLHCLVCLPVDAAGLQAQLRRLNNRRVQRLLSYLELLLAKFGSQLGDDSAHVVLPYALAFPSLPQVLCWLRATIDAHLAHLLMSPETRPQLAALQAHLRLQVAACQQLLPLQGVAEAIQGQAPLPVSHASTGTGVAGYTVQVLQVS